MPRKYTLSEMRSMHTGHFFSKDTMKFFKGDKYKTRYCKASGTNWLIVTHPSGSHAYWKFHPDTGKLTPVLAANVPEHIKE